MYHRSMIPVKPHLLGGNIFCVGKQLPGYLRITVEP